MKSSPGAWFVLAASCVSSLAADVDAPGSATGLSAPRRPTLFLIGDSTVKNGRGDGAGGLWGWGQVIAGQFDSARIKVENRALGGRSSRTFLTEGLWDRVLAELKPGDFVLMQFGHNDGGELAQGDRPRASLRGNGDESRDVVIEQTGQRELVRTYGWYLRRYIADAKAKGASPIVLSPIPRNIWKNGRVARATNDYGRWAAEAAKAGDAAFVDLNEIVARRYESVGQTSVQRDYFTAADHTHTTQAGARVNAECVVQGLRELTACPLRLFLVSNAGPRQPRLGATDWRLDFGSGNPAPGFIPVQPTTVYSRELGHGFDLGSTVKAMDRGGDDPVRRDFVMSERPFFFSVTRCIQFCKPQNTPNTRKKKGTTRHGSSLAGLNSSFLPSVLFRVFPVFRGSSSCCREDHLGAVALDGSSMSKVSRAKTMLS